MIAERFVGRSIGNLVLQHIAICANYEGIVSAAHVAVLASSNFFHNVFLRDKNAKTNGFALGVDGVASGEIAAPTAAQTFLIAKLGRAFYIDNAGRELVSADVDVLLGEVNFDIGVAMAGILDIADSEIKGRFAGRMAPTTIH